MVINALIQVLAIILLAAEVTKNFGLEVRSYPESMVSLADGTTLRSSLYIKALIAFG